MSLMTWMVQKYWKWRGIIMKEVNDITMIYIFTKTIDLHQMLCWSCVLICWLLMNEVIVISKTFPV